MNTDPVERRLDAFAKQPLPPAPGDLAAGVWQEIERRRTASAFSWESLLSPRLALAGLAFALLAGVVPAVAFSKAQSAKRRAADSLHFDAFSTRVAGQMINGLTASQSDTSRHSP